MRNYVNVFSVIATIYLALKFCVYQALDPHTVKTQHTWDPTVLVNVGIGVLFVVTLVAFALCCYAAWRESDEDDHNNLVRDGAYALLAAAAALSSFDVGGLWWSGILMLGTWFAMFLAGAYIRMTRLAELADGEGGVLVVCAIATVLAGMALKKSLSDDGTLNWGFIVVTTVLFGGGWLLGILFSRHGERVAKVIHTHHVNLTA